MQYLCIVHVYTYTRMHYVAIHVTCVLVGMRLYMSIGPVASLKLRLLAVNRTQEVNNTENSVLHQSSCW